MTYSPGCCFHPDCTGDPDSPGYERSRNSQNQSTGSRWLEGKRRRKTLQMNSEQNHNQYQHRQANYVKLKLNKSTIDNYLTSKSRNYNQQSEKKFPHLYFCYYLHYLIFCSTKYCNERAHGNSAFYTIILPSNKKMTNIKNK